MTDAGRLGPLAEREFRLLFLGRVTSLFGSAMAPIALAFAVLELTGSASDLGLVFAASWLPQVFLVLVGGVWADRLPRNLVIVSTDLTSAAMQGIVAALFLTGHAQLWHLLVTQVVRGIAISFFFPASTGLVPQTVSRPQLQQANALLRLSQNVVLIAGAAGGGALVASAGPGWALGFDGLTYLVSAAFLSRMQIAAAREPATGRSFLAELREGWDEVRSRTWLWVIVTSATFGNLIWQGSFFVLGPLVAKESLGGAGAWGAILACNSIGLVAAGLVTLRLRPRRPLLVANLALFFVPVLLALLAATKQVAVIAGAAFFAGVGVEIFSVFWDTALQQHIPADRLSRVSSYDALGSFVFIPLGLVVGGPLAAAIGISATFWVAAAAYGVVTLAALSSRDVRTLPRSDAQLAEAEAEAEAAIAAS